MYEGLQLEISSTVDRVVDEIRRALFAGEIPPGTPLREVALSEAMGVGRSTIREALGVLVAEGVAVRVPNKGVAVKELSAGDVSDVARARAALEAAGVRHWSEAEESARRAVHDALRHYGVVAARTHDPAVLTEAHLQVHRALVGLTGSERLLAAADAISGEIRLGLAHLERTRSNTREQIASHAHLVELLEAGEIAAALADLDAHLASAEASLLEATGHGKVQP